METESLGYRMLQLGAPDRNRVQRNEEFTNLEGLVTHHPDYNRNAQLSDGVVVGGEDHRRRTYGVVGGEIQEVEAARTDEYRALTQDQVLLVKDFILEDSRIASGQPGVRQVDVPAPMAGYVGRVDAANGVVDILDRRGGEVIVRARHLDPIAVHVGDEVGYGQSLGIQSNRGLNARAGKHVHFEVDTRYYQHYENYIEDLASGRLSIDPARRTQGIEARPVIDDGVIRIGESADIVRLIQHRLNAEGFRDANGGLLQEDGVYRLSMQPAVINYQNARGLPASGDLDSATLQQIAPRVFPPEVNRLEHDAHPSYLNLHSGTMPEEDPLHRQAERAVRCLEQNLGRNYDGNSARLVASAACLAKENGLTQIDHVLLSRTTGTAQHGENLFVVQGEPDDPAHLRAHMRTDAALGRSVEQSLAQLQALNETQSRWQEQQPEQRGHVHAPQPGLG